MKDFNIYLSGGMGNFGKEKFSEGNEWRKYCKNVLDNEEDITYRVRVFNPNGYYNFVDEPPKYNSEREVMEYDLYKLRNSDLVIMNYNDMYSLGSMSELAIAYEMKIPVIGLNIDKQKLHPWQVEMTNKMFYDIDEMLKYVKEFYLE